MITSTANEKIKHAAALQQKARLRREESLFVIEGGRLFWEAPASLIQEVYVSERFLENVDGKMKERLWGSGEGPWGRPKLLRGRTPITVQPMMPTRPIVRGAF